MRLRLGGWKGLREFWFARLKRKPMVVEAIDIEIALKEGVEATISTTVEAGFGRGLWKRQTNQP